MGTHRRVLCAGRAFQLIPTRQGLDGYQKSLYPCAVDESRLSIGKVKQSSSGGISVLIDTTISITINPFNLPVF